MDTEALKRGQTRRDWRLWIATAVALLAVIASFRAAFGSYFLLDDFGMLAIARFLDNPLEPFYREHIPGAVFYRPMGMMLWWISERMFGAFAGPHYALNLFLHLGVAAALWQLVAQMSGRHWPGFACAAAFACHPIGIGTTLWLSDRFDLLALLFVLLALRQAWRFSERGSSSALTLALLFLFCGLLSKEIALAGCSAVAVMWLRADTSLGWPVRFRGLACLLLVIIAYFCIRTLALPGHGSGWLSGLQFPLRTFVDGMRIWTQGWWDYSTHWPRLSGWKFLALSVALLLLAALMIMAAKFPWTPARQRAVLVGLALWLFTALLQWPLLAYQDLRLDQATDALHVALNGRYFYSGLAGMLIVLGATLSPLSRAGIAGRRLLLVALTLLGVAGFSVSQHLARSYRNATIVQRSIVEAAVEAIEKLDLPEGACQIYLLGTDNWMFKWVSDEAIKAVTPQFSKIASCLVQTEHTPWYHLAVVDRFDLEALYPLRPIHGADESRATRPLGRGRFLFLNVAAGASVAGREHLRFLSWNGESFDDVTAEVRTGQRHPALICNRSPEECLE